MRAIVISEWSDPQQYPLVDVPEPSAPGPLDLLMEVHTVGIVFGDTLVSTGRYQVRPNLPFTPGAECSGTVLAVGEGTVGYKPGDHIAAFGFIGNSREGRRILGSSAERIVIPAANAIKVSADVDLEQAALFRSNAETSYFGLQEGRLKAGETLLVLGASGGTGYAAVELGKMMGARVIGSASSAAGRSLAAKAGADVTIDSSAENWRDLVNEATGGQGIDVVYDPVGGELSEKAFRSLGYKGRHVVIGFAAGSIPKLALNLPLMKAASVIGANLLRANEMEADRVRENAEYLMAQFSAGKLSAPPVVQRYPLEQTSDAYNHVAHGRPVGRVVIRVKSDA